MEYSIQLEQRCHQGIKIGEGGGEEQKGKKRRAGQGRCMFSVVVVVAALLPLASARLLIPASRVERSRLPTCTASNLQDRHGTYHYVLYYYLPSVPLKIHVHRWALRLEQPRDCMHPGRWRRNLDPTESIASAMAPHALIRRSGDQTLTESTVASVTSGFIKSAIA